MSELFYIRFDLLVNSQSVKFVKVNGRDFIIAPIRIIKQGILAGNRGALYYPNDEIAKSVYGWNGKPITVRHPIINGKEVSANRPDVFEKQSIGWIYNSHLDKDGSLLVEGWFDSEITKQKDSRIYEALTQAKKIEVSTGLYTENIEAPANSVYEGTAYKQIATNFKPDHLAILPDEIGACSLNDGCGVFNSEGEKLLKTNTLVQFDNNKIPPINILPIVNTEEPMNPLIEILTNSCKCLNNPESKKRLEGLNANALKEVVIENINTIVANDADGKFFAWLGNADPETKSAIVKLIREKMIGNAPAVPPEKKAVDTTGTDGDAAAAKAAEDEKKKKDAAAMAASDATTNKTLTEEQYLATLPPSIRETVLNAKKINDNEKVRLVNLLTAHITDNTKKQAMAVSLMQKGLPDLQERVDMLPPQPSNNQQTQQPNNNQQVPHPLANFFGSQGAPTDNANLAYLQEEKLVAPTYNWSEISKQKD